MVTHRRTILEEREKEVLHPRAALSTEHTRKATLLSDHRLPYRRDVDRIIHSKAYARYSDKTQVVYLVDNDHITHRGLHVQLVSNYARGIAEMLQLNIDLVEAIALGHDVGHPPFGHEGEGYLSSLSQQHGEGAFAHPWQSCRLLEEIEPLNLGLAVYDGFLCHDGGLSGPELRPHFDKSWEIHEQERTVKLLTPQKNILPATLEGCLVKLCDTISYIGKDIEDAITLRLLQREEVPETCLGRSNSEMLSLLASDLIHNSYNKEYIAISTDAFAALKELRTFNFRKIYTHPLLKVESKKIKRSYSLLFNTLLNDYETHHSKSFLWSHYLHDKNNDYRSHTSSVRMAIDFIAGMTDNYFVQTLKRLTIPSSIELGPCNFS